MLGGGCRAQVAVPAPRVLVAFGATKYPPPWESIKKPHPGLDIEVDASGTVIAMADGKVRFVTDVMPTSVGIDLYIEHPAIGHVVIYQHFASVAVRAGDVVQRGQVLGDVVRPAHSVGAVTGPLTWIPHVHVQTCSRPCRQPLVDPRPFITSCLSTARPDDIVWPVPC
jgi:murein DD-endopeptidase MepM/ murein hydrolase activator NlpD